MIDEHEFNSAWYGAPAGIIRDPAWLARSDDEVKAGLARFAWAELRAAPGAVDRARLARLGFFVADTQIIFRLGLRAVATTPSAESFALRWADESPFTVAASEMAPFLHEPYAQLPGMTQERLDERYARWGTLLLGSAPATCVRVEQNGETQGWFFSEPRGSRLRLALAGTARGATASGLHLYQAAALGYAARGHGVGEATFSVHNTAVLNIYAHLGARFVATEDRWLWIA